MAEAGMSLRWCSWGGPPDVGDKRQDSGLTRPRTNRVPEVSRRASRVGVASGAVIGDGHSVVVGSGLAIGVLPSG